MNIVTHTESNRLTLDPEKFSNCKLFELKNLKQSFKKSCQSLASSLKRGKRSFNNGLKARMVRIRVKLVNVHLENLNNQSFATLKQFPSLLETKTQTWYSNELGRYH